MELMTFREYLLFLKDIATTKTELESLDRLLEDAE